MSSNLKPEPINRLTTKIGVVEGRKTNIKIGKTKKAKTNFKNNGVLSSDQKWKIYKSEIEPKLTDRIFEEEEPDNKMLEIIKEALKETNVKLAGYPLQIITSTPQGEMTMTATSFSKELRYQFIFSSSICILHSNNVKHFDLMY